MTKANKRADPISDEVEAAIQKKIASDPENPEWTDEEIKRARPFREVLPELAANIDRAIAARGRPPAGKTKMPVTIRLDPEVVNFYKSTGKGWQSRMNDDLRKAAGV